MLARYARNRRLADAVQQWAFCAMRGSPGARAYYQALRQRGTGHQAALRQLGNRLVGILHGCLKSGTATTKQPPGHIHNQPLDNEKPGMSAAIRASAPPRTRPRCLISASRCQQVLHWTATVTDMSMSM